MNRRNAVIVSWHLPPAPGIGGRRAQQLLDHLPSTGWDVQVVAARLKGATRGDERVIETARGKLGEWVRAVLPARDEPLFEQWAGAPSQGTGGSKRARALRATRGVLLMPDEYAPWAVMGRAAAARLGSVDAVISTSPPFSAHLLGRWLARRFDAPHIVDYRDPFSRNAGWPPGWADRRLKEALDRSVIRSADAVVTTSDGFAGLLRELGAPSVDVVRNAWADIDRAPAQEPPTDAPLTLVQTGTLYDDYLPLLDMLRRAMDGRNVRLVHCGRGARSAGWIDDRGVVSREDAAAMRASSSALLLLLPPSAEGVWGVPSKLYDYIAAGRPVLTIGEGDPEKRALLGEAGLMTPVNSVEDVAAALDRLTKAQSAGRLATLAAAADVAEQFGPRALANSYGAILDRVTVRRNSGGTGTAARETPRPG